MGDPRSRQQALVGGIVAFPQDGGPLLDLLPRRAGELAEYFPVVFSSDDSDKVRSHRALLVRRTRVAAALRWLKQHNLRYADVCISEDNLAALPESAVPDVFLQAVSAGEAAHNEQGHFSSCTGLDFRVGRSAFQLCVDVCGCRLLTVRTRERRRRAGQLQRLAQCCVHRRGGFCALSCSPRVGGLDLSKATTNMSMYLGLERQPSDILAAALQAAHAQEAMSGLTSGQAATDMEAATRDAPDDSRLVGIAPHSSVPLNSYDPSYWPICHPLHFPYGIGGHGASRMAALSDETWCRHLLLRGDRGDDTAWCRSLPLVAVLFSTLHRRRLLRAIRVYVCRPLPGPALFANWKPCAALTLGRSTTCWERKALRTGSPRR